MKLSIITINYNNAEGLRKTLASVASQTYADIEHVIVDGGSTDGSVEIIRQYADNEAMRQEKNGKADIPASTPYTLHHTPSAHVVRWISEPDKGIYNAMNKGIEIALGRRVVSDDHTSSPNSLIASSSHRLSDYIQILNSGDILAADDVTERMMAALKENVKQQHQQQNTNNHSVMEQHTITANENNALSPHRLIASSPIENRPAIFYGNMIKEYPDGRRVKDTCLGDYKTKDRGIVLRETEWTMYDFIKGTINHDPTYIRRDIYEKYGLYDDSLKIVSDWKWFVQAVIFGAEEVYYIPLDVTIFDMTGISETNVAAREVERRNELEKMFPMAVLKDYDAYHFPISQIQRLKRHHMWPLVYFVERVLFKLEKWGILK